MADKRMLYKAHYTFSLPGLCTNAPLYKDTDGFLWWVVDDQVAYQFHVKGEHAKFASVNEGGRNFKADERHITLGESTSHFQVSALTWQEFNEDEDIRESLAEVRKTVCGMANRERVDETINMLVTRISKLETTLRNLLAELGVDEDAVPF